MSKVVQSFRLISGQILIGQTEKPMSECIKDKEFTIHNPVEIQYEPSFDDMGDRVGVEAYFGDFISEFRDNYVSIKSEHVMIWRDDTNEFLKRQYVDFLPFLEETRREREEDEASYMERLSGNNPEFSDNNRELREEILADINNDEKTKKTLH